MFFQPAVAPLKTNIAPERWWLEDYFPFGKVYLENLVLKIESFPQLGVTIKTYMKPPSSIYIYNFFYQITS